ncbi:flagellar FlbD family protein [Caproicibacterium argilliputei]|uniref:Flagellar FlbD family protein n=2 Tax=Caproicibacterium TaxID=2834348 RepID=A0AA97D9E9_9FIRM|nr:flagellar FlbD family protein [Caproicibacterium argilliputei]WOC31266.1 flagellar FlbD family protein [Caproicibacterium argilliputei]
MIMLTKLNGMEFALNDELIETISEMPDTTITMTNKNLYIVQESTHEVIDKIIDFRREVFRGLTNVK